MKITMKFFTLLLGAIAAYGQTVSLSDTLTNAVGGGSFTGRVTVTLNAPGNASPLYYSTTSLTGWQAVYCIGVTGADCTTTAAAGTFAATLYANSTITPAGTSYSARFQPTKGSPWSETWTVEASDTKLYQVRSTTVPSPTVTFQPSQLALAAGSLVYGSSGGVGTALAAGTNGHILTLSGGYPTWAASTGGVTSITGTANQITSSASTGAVTLSLPATITGLTSVTSTGFTGALTGNASTATALASTVASGRLWIGQGTGAPTSDSVICADTTNHRLGVGTCSPAQRLDVQEAASGAGVMRIQNTNTGGYSALDGYDSAGTLQVSIGYGNSAAAAFTSTAFVGSRSNIPVLLLQNTTEKARFAATSGNLLIGTTTDLGYGLHAANKGTNGNFLCYDPTATTGVSTCDFRAGAGQSTTSVIRVLASNGTTELLKIRGSDGYVYTGGGYTDIGNANYQINSTRFEAKSTYLYAWVSGALGTSLDLSLSRSAANTLQVGDGGANANGTLLLTAVQWQTGTRPTCNVGNRFKTWAVAGGAGVLDTFEVCRKDAADAYAWVTLF